MVNLIYKLAETKAEFEQIHRLNYRTFVEEIPQHAPNLERRLVDKFHGENRYIIAVDGEQVVGMVCFRGNRPFSLDTKVTNLNQYLPTNSTPCEIRLLAIEPAYRHSRVFANLMLMCMQQLHASDYDVAILSGTTRQLNLYSHMGYEPFGELVGKEGAYYQPMMQTRAKFLYAYPTYKRLLPQRADTINLSPGPVGLSQSVLDALGGTPISHRSAQFHALFQDTKQRLLALTRASFVEIMTGSGTLANDVVAAQLKLLKGKGLILSNGEFGDRLIDHGQRQGLTFSTIEMAWGDCFAHSDIEEKMKTADWLWFAHCETSTGMLNALPRLVELAKKYAVKLCVDCMSSLGVVDVDLTAVYLATGTSGKGLAAPAGLAFVFYNEERGITADLPRYFDLGYYRAKKGVPFTISSNLVAALNASLKQMDFSQRFAYLRTVAAWLRYEFKERDVRLLVGEVGGITAVFTLPIPANKSARKIGNALREKGILLSYESDYLVERNWLQACIFANIQQIDLSVFLDELKTELS